MPQKKVTKHSLLIVEDEANLAKVLRERFIKEDFEVSSAYNGKEGLAMALRDHPDVILLDILMPVMDGLTMLKKMREDSWGKEAFVIILSNLSESDRVSEALDRGVYDFLVKTDWKLDDVVEIVKKKMKK